MVIQLFGETINQPTLALNQTFTVTRAVVPCTYELTGQMLGNRTLTIYFGRTSPFSNAEQGIERGSMVIDEGPGTFGPATTGCSVIFRVLSPDGGPTPPGPYNIKLHFRVSRTNAITSSGGCGEPTPTLAPAPTPTPAPAPVVNLSGAWSGTVTPTISGATRPPFTVAVTFQHAGSQLTGTFTGFGASFDLAEASSTGTSKTFTGTLAIAPSARMAGSMAVDTIANTMTGTFSGTNTDGLPEINNLSLRKQ